MSDSPPPLSPEMDALLERERGIPPVPAAVRARALARARAALDPARDVALPAPPRGATRHRWAVAAALACMASAAVAAAGYGIRARRVARPSRPAVAAPVATVAVPRAPSEPPAPAADVPAAPASAPSVAPRLSPADAARAELRLLRQARAAVARNDFAAALPPIAEHTRRFKDGRLAEEREALRVRALVGLGRAEEGRRAAAAFEARFPRSVLLPAVSRMPAPRP